MRHIAFDIVQTSTCFDGIFVFGPGSGKLPTKLAQLDVTGFLLVASNVITCQQQVAVIQRKVALKSRNRHFADTADFRAGQSCRTIQFDCLTVFLFRLRTNPPGTVAWTISVIGNVHNFLALCIRLLNKQANCSFYR